MNVNSFFILIVVSSFCFIPIYCQSDDTTGLGYLQAFSVFVYGDISASNSETRGRMASGADITLESYSIGQALTYNCLRTDLLVGHNLIFNEGSVQRGKITYRGELSLTDVGLSCETAFSTSHLLDFNDIFTKLNDTVYKLQEHFPTAFTRTSDTSLTLKGFFAKNYFKIDSETLATITNIYIDVPINASVTVSISGTSVSIGNLGITLSDTTDPQRILWTMYNAETVDISDIQLFGSILAPSANINLMSGSLVGSIACFSLTSGAAIDYSPYIPPDANCTCINCPNIWYLPPFSLYVFDTLSMTETQDSGRIAAGGDVNLSSFSIGNSLQLFPITTNSTVIGGSLEFTSGSINGGNVIVAGTATVIDVDVINGIVKDNTPVALNFTEEFKNLTFNTNYFSKLRSNGQISLLYSTLTLSSEDIGLNIFSLTSIDFNLATNVIIDCPETSWAILNIPDRDAFLDSIYVQLVGISANRVLFNFYEAETLTISAVGVEGSILAPKADVTFPTGNINGNLVCNSVTGSGATSKFLPIPLKPPCPPCLCVGDV